MHDSCAQQVMPARMELYLIYTVAVAVMRVQLWHISIGLEAPGDRLRSSRPLAKRAQVPLSPACALTLHALYQSYILLKDVVVHQWWWLIEPLVCGLPSGANLRLRRHDAAPFAAHNCPREHSSMVQTHVVQPGAQTPPRECSLLARRRAGAREHIMGRARRQRGRRIERAYMRLRQGQGWASSATGQRLIRHRSVPRHYMDRTNGPNQ